MTEGLGGGTEEEFGQWVTKLMFEEGPLQGRRCAYKWHVFLWMSKLSLWIRTDVTSFLEHA